MPAQARARAAATYMISPSATCETRRSRMPVRRGDPLVAGVEESGDVGIGEDGRRQALAPAGDGRPPRMRMAWAGRIGARNGSPWRDPLPRVHAHDRTQLFPLAPASLAWPGDRRRRPAHRQRLHRNHAVRHDQVRDRQGLGLPAGRPAAALLVATRPRCMASFPRPTAVRASPSWRRVPSAATAIRSISA